MGFSRGGRQTECKHADRIAEKGRFGAFLDAKQGKKWYWGNLQFCQLLFVQLHGKLLGLSRTRRDNWDYWYGRATSNYLNTFTCFYCCLETVYDSSCFPLCPRTPEVNQLPSSISLVMKHLQIFPFPHSPLCPISQVPQQRWGGSGLHKEGQGGGGRRPARHQGKLLHEEELCLSTNTDCSREVG